MPNEHNLIYWVIGFGALLLPWWLFKLWQSLHAIFNTPKPPPPPKYHVHKVNTSVSFWLRGSVLFTVGGLLTFLGFVCTIYFRNPQFLLLIIAGSLFLSGLFFHTYLFVFPDHERAQKKTPEHLQVYTHPYWLFQYPFFALFGLFNVFAGSICAYHYQDIYFMLLSIYGLVFLLHLWSFAQLNILTITDQTLKLYTGLPANGILTIPLHTIVDIQMTQPFYQRPFRVHKISIVDEQGAKLVLHTNLPHLFWGTLIEEDI